MFDFRRATDGLDAIETGAVCLDLLDARATIASLEALLTKIRASLHAEGRIAGYEYVTAEEVGFGQIETLIANFDEAPAALPPEPG